MPAENRQTAVVQGTLHMLILKTLALEPMHGYGIGVRLERIEQRSVPVEQHKFNRGLIFYRHRNELGVANKSERLAFITVCSKQSNTEFANTPKRVELCGVIYCAGNSNALMRWFA